MADCSTFSQCCGAVHFFTSPGLPSFRGAAPAPTTATKNLIFFFINYRNLFYNYIFNMMEVPKNSNVLKYLNNFKNVDVDQFCSSSGAGAAPSERPRRQLNKGDSGSAKLHFSILNIRVDEDLTSLLEDPDRNLLSLCVEKVGTGTLFLQNQEVFRIDDKDMTALPRLD